MFLEPTRSWPAEQDSPVAEVTEGRAAARGWALKLGGAQEDDSKLPGSPALDTCSCLPQADSGN